MNTPELNLGGLDGLYRFAKEEARLAFLTALDEKLLVDGEGVEEEAFETYWKKRLKKIMGK